MGRERSNDPAEIETNHALARPGAVPFRAMRGYYSPQLVGAVGDDPAVSVLPPM